MKIHIYMKNHNLCIIMFLLAGISAVESPAKQRVSGEYSVRLAGNMTIVSVNKPESAFLQADPMPEVQASPQATPYPRPPLAGFTPLVAITTSNASEDDFYAEHVVEQTYSGYPLNPPAFSNYIIGIFDTGSVLDLFAGDSRQILGLTGANLTNTSFPVGGVSGTIDGTLTQPLGVYAAGLRAIEPDGRIDPNYLVGHSNTVALATPEISCGGGEAVSGVIGTPFVSFFTTEILVDTPVHVKKDNTDYISPDVRIMDSYNPSPAAYPHRIPMAAEGLLPVTTAAYYFDYEPFDDEITITMPTLLTLVPLSIPTGGAFYTDLELSNTDPNNVKNAHVLVDFGAQSSIISPAVAAKLNLPLEPDFTVDVCGVGGILEDVPVYYVKFARLNAWGGALEYSLAPFVVLDLQDSDGTSLDGVLGTNMFWNRNVVFQPNLSGSSFVHVSDPVPFAYVDYNFDNEVNLVDFNIFSDAWLSGPEDINWHPMCDLYKDDYIDAIDLESFIDRWLMYHNR